MRKLWFLLSVLLAGAALATPITLIVGTRFEFTDCSSSGSAAQTVTAGNYIFRVTSEDVWICYAATCATTGEKFPAGTVMHLRFEASQSVSCRSTSSTGDAIFTRGE